MAEFRDGFNAWNTNRRPTKLVEGMSVHQTVDARHLHAHLGTEHIQTLNIGYAQMFSATDRYFGKPLVGMTEAKGKAKMIHGNRFRWELSGGNNEYPRITKVATADTRPGRHNTAFDIVVDKPYFNIGDIIQPEDNRYRFLVIVPDGSASRQLRVEANYGYRYTIKLLANDDGSRFCPTEFLQVGHEWNQVSNAVADENNMDGSGFHFYSVFESQGQLQQHSVKYSLTDKACKRIHQAKMNKENTCDIPGSENHGERVSYQSITKSLWVKVKNKVEGRQADAWMNAFDAELMNTLYNNVENTLMFGQKSSTNYSPEGHQILTASGLREQLESGWVYRHNGTLDLQAMEEWFDSILKDRISEGQQKIVMSAGREFRKAFDRMIKEEARSFTTIDTLFIRKGENYRHLDLSKVPTYRNVA